MTGRDPPSARLRGAIFRGVFPHQVAWLLENPLRRVILKPETLAERVGIVPGSRVLELGPGSGYFSRHLAQRAGSGSVVLVDLQPQMLEIARRKLTVDVPTAVYVAASAEGLPFPPATFDAAVLVAVLGEVPNASRCLAALRGILRPTGILAIHEHLPDPDFISIGKLKELARDAGFRFERSHGAAWNYTAVFRRVGSGMASGRIDSGNRQQSAQATVPFSCARPQTSRPSNVPDRSAVDDRKETITRRSPKDA